MTWIRWLPSRPRITGALFSRACLCSARFGEDEEESEFEPESESESSDSDSESELVLEFERECVSDLQPDRTRSRSSSFVNFGEPECDRTGLAVPLEDELELELDSSDESLSLLESELPAEDGIREISVSCVASD